MRKVLVLLIGLFVAANCFGFETQTAVENSKYAAVVMQEVGATVEQATVYVAKKYLVLIAKNMNKPADVFNWSDEQADEVTAVVDNLYHSIYLGKDCNEDVFTNEMWVTQMNLVESIADLVETFGFGRDEALNIAIKTINDLIEESD